MPYLYLQASQGVAKPSSSSSSSSSGGSSTTSSASSSSNGGGSSTNAQSAEANGRKRIAAPTSDECDLVPGRAVRCVQILFVVRAACVVCETIVMVVQMSSLRRKMQQ
jgi:hypothetical protein